MLLQQGLLQPKRNSENATWHATKRCLKQQARTARPLSTLVRASQSQEVDVAVLGAGIVGLCTAHALLQAEPDLRVALIDRAGLCAGATGAGQGYVWLAHRQPGNAVWQMAVESKKLWEQFCENSIGSAIQQPPPADACEWQVNGSILLAASEDDITSLKAQEAALREAGVNAQWLDAAALQQQEPTLVPLLGGLQVPHDAQLSGKQASSRLLEECQAVDAQGAPGAPSRLQLMLQTDVSELKVDGNGTVTGVRTAAGDVNARLGVVVCMGAWSGPLLQGATGDPAWEGALRPRKGHLLVVPPPSRQAPPAHGLMEMQYKANLAKAIKLPEADSQGPPPDAAFTATTDAHGNVLLGSSRSFSGFNDDAEDRVAKAIIARGAQYLPWLSNVTPQDCTVRVGLRPFSSRGTPYIGPVQPLKGLYVAAGHEGAGLTLGPATAQLLLHYTLGKGNAPAYAEPLLPPQPQLAKA